MRRGPREREPTSLLDFGLARLAVLHSPDLRLFSPSLPLSISYNMTLDAVLKQHLPSNLHPLLDRAPGPLDPVTSGAGPWDSSLTPLINSSGPSLPSLPVHISLWPHP